MRSLLFAPAGNPELIAKLPRSQPDAVVIDLEDGVPAEHKDSARAGLARAIRDLPDELTICVRVNPVGTPWFESDIAALPARVAHVVVPKVETAEQVQRVAHSTQAEVIAGIETARGVMDVRELLFGPVTAAYFGAEDYVADLGGLRTPSSDEVLYARSRVSLACRVLGVHALDQVVVDVHDDDAFRADARRGRELGYRGKLCVHPRQVALAHEAFTPSEEEVDRARKILAAARHAAGQGRGVIVVDGAMVDEPMLRAARDVLERATSADPARRTPPA
jgi:citrate lyase subunit beta/citryl-CoA lyase